MTTHMSYKYNNIKPTSFPEGPIIVNEFLGITISQGPLTYIYAGCRLLLHSHL